MNAEIIKSRSIRQTLLRIFFNANEGMPGVCVLQEHIYQAFEASHVPPTQAQVDAELNDLIEDTMITAQDAASVGLMKRKCYKITTRGRDFYKAGCPWDKVDEFTGHQG